MLSGSALPVAAKGVRKASTLLPPYFWAALVVICVSRVLPWIAVSVFSPPEDGSPISASDTWPRRLVAGGGSSENNPGVWMGLVAAATLTKLTASTDDVVWLLPFVSSNHRQSNVKNILFYLFCMQLVVAISWGFCAGGEAVLKVFLTDNDYWPLERILELASAILLTCYTVKLFWEWWKERHEQNVLEADGPDKAGERGVPAEDTMASSPPQVAGAVVDDHGAQLQALAKADAELGPPATTVGEEEVQVAMAEIVEAAEPAAEAPNTCAERATTPPDSEQSLKVRDEKYTLGRLFTISMFGSLDDFAVFVSLMLSGVLAAWQLSVGVLLGSVIVVLVCAGAGLCKCVVQVVEKIPLWVIIGAFAIWTFIATFAMH